MDRWDPPEQPLLAPLQAGDRGQRAPVQLAADEMVVGGKGGCLWRVGTRGNVIRWRWQTLNPICKGCGTRIRSFRPSFSWWLSRASNWDWCYVAPKGSDPLRIWLWGFVGTGWTETVTLGRGGTAGSGGLLKEGCQFGGGCPGSFGLCWAGVGTVLPLAAPATGVAAAGLSAFGRGCCCGPCVSIIPIPLLWARVLCP